MIEINLIPNVKLELIKAQRIRSTVILSSIIVGIVSISIVILLVIYVYTFQAVRSKLADDSIKQGSSQLASVEDLSKTLTIQNQLTKISNLNNSKNIDSRIFDVLNVIIPPAPNDIKISTLVVNSEEGSIVIEGQAAGSYAAVEVFRKTIDGSKVRYTDSTDEKREIELASNVSTSDMSYGEDSSGTKVLRFKLSFTYAKELFSIDSKKASIAITIDGNVTDSYLGVPKSIFVDRAKDIKENE